LGPRFDGFLEAVMAHCSFRFEPVRAHLEAGFDRISEALQASGQMDERGLVELRSSLIRVSNEANTLGDLSAAYRRAIADVQAAVARPSDARQDRSLRRALTFIREHLSEPLT